MHGKWFLGVFGFGALILLIVGLSVAFSAIAAAAIAFLLIVVLLIAFSVRRGSQVGSEHAAAAADRRRSDHVPSPRQQGAPRSGEGGAEEASNVRLTGG
jgi:membrane protein implicated in regulation of membrane protease activity